MRGANNAAAQRNRSVQAPFATNLDVTGEVVTVADAYGRAPGEELGAPGSEPWPSQDHPRAAQVRDPRWREHAESSYASPPASGGGRAPLPPIRSARREQYGPESPPDSRENRRASRGQVSSDADPRRIELAELEQRIEQTEATAKTLLRQALVTNADIDRAWQMLQSHGDPRAAAAQQRWLLKDHIRAITEVAHQLTKELDQVEVNAQREVRELATSLTEMKRVQQHAVGAITTTHRASQAAVAAEIRGLKAQLAQSQENHARLERVVEGQAAQMQKMAENFMATIQALAQKQQDDAAAARQATKDLQSETQSTAATLRKGLDHLYTAINETNDVVVGNKAEIDQFLPRFREGIIDQTRSEAAERVNQIRAELAQITSQMDQDRKQAADTAARNREACEALTEKKFAEANAEALRLAKALERHLLDGAIKQLAENMNKVETTCKERLDRMLDSTKDGFIATKDELRAVRADVEARWAATESRVLGDMAVLEGKTSNSEMKVDMLGALFQSKTDELEGKLDKNSFVVLT